MEHQLLEFNLTRAASLEGGLVREVVISTEKPVRSGGGIARAAGAVLAPYMRNPVVMWAHNYREPPVAKATALQVEPGVGISAKFEFPAPGVYPLADVVRGLWDGGFINAASIGFSPLEWEMIPDPEAPAPKSPASRTETVPVFTKWELYEFSLVAVPRDREAVRRALEIVATGGNITSDRERRVKFTFDECSAMALEDLSEEDRAFLAAYVGSRPVAVAALALQQMVELDRQRLLDGLKAVKVAFHA